jgi:hypothetical protein
VTIDGDGFKIDKWIYWTLWIQRVTTLQFTVAHTHTNVHSHIFTSRCLVAAFNGGRSPSSEFPNCPWPQLLASHSNSSQRLNPSCYLTNLLTERQREQREKREKEIGEEVVRDTTLGGGVRNYISGFEGSQAVPHCPSGIVKAYYRNFVIYTYMFYIYMTLEGLY